MVRFDENVYEETEIQEREYYRAGFLSSNRGISWLLVATTLSVCHTEACFPGDVRSGIAGLRCTMVASPTYITSCLDIRREFVFLLKVRVDSEEQFDKAVRRFKRLCSKEGIISESRKRRFYEKPSDRKRRIRLKQKRRLEQKLERKTVGRSSR